MRRLVLIAVLLMCAGTAYALTDYIRPSEWRYRITVVVETPEGIKTGSAVRQVSALRQPQISPHVNTSVNIKGEAVAVDLGERGVLFALIDWNSYYEVFSAFPRPGGGETTPEGLAFYRNLKPGMTAPLDPARHPGYPRLITFRDLTDSKTLEVVMVWDKSENPYVLKQDRFKELFGKGVKLREIIIEITDDPVTWHIGNLVPKFDDSFSEWSRSLKYGDPRIIGMYNFMIGGKP